MYIMKDHSKIYLTIDFTYIKDEIVNLLLLKRYKSNYEMFSVKYYFIYIDYLSVKCFESLKTNCNFLIKKS